MGNRTRIRTRVDGPLVGNRTEQFNDPLKADIGTAIWFTLYSS
jgi:hypothetical protein